jgi:hypothetical protein
MRPLALAFRSVGGRRVSDPMSIVLSSREATAKWLRSRSLSIKVKHHVRRYAQPVTGDPFLNRVSRPDTPPPRAKVSARQPSPDGLVFGLIRMRSSTFIDVRIGAAMLIYARRVSESCTYGVHHHA